MSKFASFIMLFLCAIVCLSMIFQCHSIAKEIELTGSGATFPLPFYLKAFSQYHKQHKIKINYTGVGSGEGLKALISKTTDFAGTDFIRVEGFPANVDELVYMPTCIGAVVIIYNLTDNPHINFTPEILSEIFLGRIKKWNDQKLKNINREIRLPDLPITPVRRSDRSGTTFVFSELLSKNSELWKKNVGMKNILSGLPGFEAKGNPGVAGLVKQTSGAIGYVELIYALANNLSTGSVMNTSKKFIKPSVESIKKALEGYKLENQLNTLIETSNPNGYPISCFSFIAVLKEQDYSGRDIQTARELVKMIRWLIGEGQQYGEILHYVPLTSNIQEISRKLLEEVTYRGAPVSPK